MAFAEQLEDGAHVELHYPLWLFDGEDLARDPGEEDAEIGLGEMRGGSGVVEVWAWPAVIIDGMRFGCWVRGKQAFRGFEVNSPFVEGLGLDGKDPAAAWSTWSIAWERFVP